MTTQSGTVAAARTSGGDVYAGANGNVYKKSGGQWQKYDNGGWNPAAESHQGDMQSLNQEFDNRQRGAFQSDRFQGFQRSGGLVVAQWLGDLVVDALVGVADWTEFEQA